MHNSSIDSGLPIDFKLLRFLVQRVRATELAVLLHLQPLSLLLLVARRGIVPALALAARQVHGVTHCCRLTR